MAAKLKIEKREDENCLKPFPFLQSLVAIGPVVSEEKIFM
jgi:hypothetical protein